MLSDRDTLAKDDNPLHWIDDDCSQHDCEEEPLVLQNGIPTQQDRHGKPVVSSLAEIYSTKTSKIVVPQHIHYGFRRKQLKIFSLYEYVAMIDVIPKKATNKKTYEDTDNAKESGRPDNGVFSFSKGHPLLGN